MKSSKVLGAVLGLSLLLGSAVSVFASVPVEYQIGIQPDSGPNYTQNVDAPSLPTSFGGVFGIDPTTGEVKYLSLGAFSGLLDTGTGLTVSNLIADKVIAPSGDPLGYWITSILPTTYASTSTVNTLSSTVNSLAVTVSGLSASSGLSLTEIKTFMADQATTSQLIATSTFNGFMSSTSAATMANLKTVATSGSYTDLTSKPTLGISYEGTTQRTNSFPIFKSATVASGVAVVNLTSDGTSGGTSLCPNGVIQDSVSIIFNDSTSSFQQSWAFSNSNKTLTITANKFTSANILSGLLGQAAANSSVAKITVWCY